MSAQTREDLPRLTKACETSGGLGEKAHELRIDSIGMCPEHAMGTARQLDEFDVLDHLRLPSGGGIRRQDAVGVAVQDERRHVVLWDVLAEILDPAVYTVQRPNRGRTRGDVPVVFEHALAHELTARHVVVVEVSQELHQERWTIRTNRGLDVLEDFGLDAFGVVGGLHEIWPQRPDEHG